jgi:hypothetical protein
VHDGSRIQQCTTQPCTEFSLAANPPASGALLPDATTATDQGCTDSSPCPVCHGACSNDAECAGNLKCWQRGTGNSTAIPGCSGSMSGETNYCYDPLYNSTVLE